MLVNLGGWNKLENGLIGIHVVLTGYGSDMTGTATLGRIFIGPHDSIDKEAISRAVNSNDDHYHEGMINKYNLTLLDSIRTDLGYHLGITDNVFAQMKEYAIQDRRLDDVFK